ncbi:MAG: hypothetical protein ACRCZF_26870 [Gemmataceae bacterium]
MKRITTLFGKLVFMLGLVVCRPIPEAIARAEVAPKFRVDVLDDTAPGPLWEAAEVVLLTWCGNCLFAPENARHRKLFADAEPIHIPLFSRMVKHPLIEPRFVVVASKVARSRPSSLEFLQALRYRRDAEDFRNDAENRISLFPYFSTHSDE